MQSEMLKGFASQCKKFRPQARVKTISTFFLKFEVQEYAKYLGLVMY